jgi:hypothetical protein
MYFKEWIKLTQMGFRPIQAGIIRRFLREEGAWGSHLNNSREYILSTVKDVKPRSIRILGSGWLLDIPIRELIEICDYIVLDDIVHPTQIVNKYSKINKIRFETTDITNGIVDLCYEQKRNGFHFDTFIERLSQIDSKVFSEDLIVSGNILSQSSVMLTDYLKKKVKVSDQQVSIIAEIIQQKVFDALPQGRSIIISDFEEEYYDEDNKLLGSKPTLYINLPVNRTKREWTWNFDTKMFYKEDCKTKLKVYAVMM